MSDNLEKFASAHLQSEGVCKCGNKGIYRRLIPNEYKREWICEDCQQKIIREFRNDITT